MNARILRIGLSLGVFSSFFSALPASATTTTLEGGCEYRADVDCSATCDSVSFEPKCEGDLAIQCEGQCTAGVDASCTGSCSADCEGRCTASPGSLTCEGDCTAGCKADCASSCHASTQGASSEADCTAKCQASCNASCNGTCTGTPPEAMCQAKCDASCSGRCSARANASCQIDCQKTRLPQCEANIKADCSAHCSTGGGVLVCDGAAQEFLDTLDEARAWIASHIVVQASASGSSSCSGNTCQAQGEASASVKCAVSRVPGAAGGEAQWTGLLLGAALAGGAAVRRRATRGRGRK